MNKTKIFNNKQLSENSSEKQLQFFGALCYLLAEALDAENEDLAWDILREASKIGHVLDAPAFNTLYGVIAMEVTRNFVKAKRQRTSILEKIKEFLHE